MNKRERVTAAFRGQETDRVPVCMWKHVPQKYWADEEQFAECQAGFYRETDVDFMKLSGDGYFPWPAPALGEIKKRRTCTGSSPWAAFIPTSGARSAGPERWSGPLERTAFLCT